MAKKIPGSVVGEVFHKSVTTRNFFRIRNAYALKAEQITAAKAKGAKFVVLFVRETGIRYQVSIDTLLELGERFQEPGYEPQIALPINKWNALALGA